MAIVQYTAIVNQLRGKLNGSVFNKSRNAYTLQSKQMPSRAQTVTQNRQRNIFGEVQRTWKTLTIPQKNDISVLASQHAVRDRFGELVYLSGYNWFIRWNLLRASVGLGISRDIDEENISGFNFSGMILNSLKLSGSGAAQQLQFLATALVTEGSSEFVDYSVFVSRSTSLGVTAFHGNYFFLGSGQLLASTPAPSVQDFEVTAAVPESLRGIAPGANVWVKMLFLTAGNGVTYQEYIFQISIT